MNSYANTHRKQSNFQRHPTANSISLVTGMLPFTSEMALFEFPFNELLVLVSRIFTITLILTTFFLFFLRFGPF